MEQLTMIANSGGNNRNHSATDAAMIQRCIRLSETAIQRKELPFATFICKAMTVLVATTNQVMQKADVTRHAELIALSEAQKKAGTKDLPACTLYTTVEPCAMCPFAIRETRIGRVVFSIKPPMMDGLSKWNVLRDTEISHALPEVSGSVPDVIAGLLRREAEAVWLKWNPGFWSAIKLGGYLGGNTKNSCEYLPSISARRGLLRRIFI